MTSSPIRSIVAILGGAVIVRFLGQALEFGLVSVTSDATAFDAYIAARNQAPTLAGVVATHLLAGVLAGYTCAKIATRAETAHAAFGALFLVLSWLLEFTRSGNPGMYPVWAQVALPVVTVPAMIAGAMVRARARVLQETT